MQTLVVVQARMGSSRLPGKVLLPVAGAPILVRMLERIRAARSSFELVVATTTDPADAPLVAACAAAGVATFRGHPTDVLDRHVQAARAAGADVVVKIPSDCPLIDPAAIDAVLDAFGEGNVDFASNLHPPSWPDGHDVEAMSLSALEIAWREATKPHEREHTTPFLWDHPERFRLRNVAWSAGRDLSMTYRMTLDYPEDYGLVAAVYESLYHTDRPVFSLAEVLAWLDEHPDVLALNHKYAGVNWYRHNLDDLHTIRPEDTRCTP